VNTNYPTPDTAFGAELNYAYLINEFWQNNYTDYIIKWAQNAADIANWLVGGAYRNTFVTWVNDALTAVDADNNNYSCVFYWDQGESDADTGDDPTTYEADFTQMITDFRTNLDVRSLPTILREMRLDQSGHPQIAEIITQQNNIVQNVPDTYLMNSYGANISLYDSIHFDAEGQIELGKRAMEQAIWLFD